MLQTMLSGVLPPLAASAVVAALWQPWRTTPPKQLKRVLAATTILVAAGYIAADLLVNGFKGWLPVASLDYRPHAAALGAIVGLVALAVPRVVGTILLAVASVAVVAWMRRRALLAENPVQAEVLFATGAAVAGIVLGMILTRSARSQAGHTALMPLGLALTALAIALLQSGSASLSQMAGALAATLGPIGLITVLRPSWSIAHGVVAPVTLTAVALVVAWRINTPSIDPLSLAAMGGALAAPAFAMLPLLSRRHPWTRTIAASLIAIAFGLLAIARTPGGFDFSGL